VAGDPRRPQFVPSWLCSPDWEDTVKVSVEALWNLGEVELLAAYHEALRLHAEKKFGATPTAPSCTGCAPKRSRRPLAA
jgi:hypothetical protein